MKANDQVLFQYSTQDGEVNEDINPNGALENIAGVCNAAKNVFGMMPHPERAADIELKNQDQIAVIHGNLRQNYSELYRRSVKLASSLNKIGIKRGDTISVFTSLYRTSSIHC